VSFYQLILVLGILGLVLLGVVLFSLLTLAQRSEAQEERSADMSNQRSWLDQPGTSDQDSGAPVPVSLAESRRA
jgi:hypothetical protein